jgi:hypothetical protein
VSVAVLLDNFLSASKEIQMEEESALFYARKQAAPVKPPKKKRKLFRM